MMSWSGKENDMKRSLLLIILAILLAAVASAAETKTLYYQSKIPGPQITKDYYIKESLKRENPKNPNLLQVKTISIVKSPEGTTTYRMTNRINCETRQSAIIEYWSTGTTAEQQRAMADGKFRPIDDFTDAPHLAKKICPKK
jgi:ABC-type glycerol-3-phosphate transport system substrate-binding protein